jgi:hypothetical protein
MNKTKESTSLGTCVLKACEDRVVRDALSEVCGGGGYLKNDSYYGRVCYEVNSKDVCVEKSCLRVCEGGACCIITKIKKQKKKIFTSYINNKLYV